MKKCLGIFLTCCLILGSNITTNASSQYKDVITKTENGAEETKLGNFSTKKIYEPQRKNLMAKKEVVVISNVSKPIRYNLFTPVSNYVAAPGTVSVSKGVDTTISASVTGGVTVDAEVLQANIESTIGASVTFTTSQTISFPVSSGYKGRVVLRYSQDYYTYTVTKNSKSYKCSAYTAAYDEYYALQQISLK
jgi:hypothetical protein